MHCTFEHNDVFLMLTPVTSTTSTLDTFNLLAALNFLGSILGLWPGLGLFQLLEGAMAMGLLAAYSAGSKARTLCSSKQRFIYVLST